MNDAELEALMADLESDRVERKEHLSDGDRIRQAICAFSNDMPGQGKPGVLFIGVNDAGVPTGMKITDDLLLVLGGIRSEGKILPLPMLTVEKHKFSGKDVAVVIVHPIYSTPARYEGRVWVRVGPRRAEATIDEERRLTEKRLSHDLPYDEHPIRGSRIDDLDIDYFKYKCLPRMIAADTLAQNGRTIEEQMASLRFLAPDLSTPTTVGMLVLGKNPLTWVSGAYIQFVRFDGNELSDAIKNHKRFDRRLEQIIEEIDFFLPLAIEKKRAPQRGTMQHIDVVDYPVEALRELVFNAIMHRSYDASNAPINIRWFDDRVEISNSGGLYGKVTLLNFERTNDYRNPTLAESMRALRYVERFGVGISRVKALLAANGNPPPEFNFEADLSTVVVRRSNHFMTS